MVKVDCLIAGAGPAGCALGQTLHRAGFDVAIVERRRGARSDASETLPPAAVRLARRLGDIAECSTDYRGLVSIWGSSSPQEQDFFFTPEGGGLCINRAGLDDALRLQTERQGVPVSKGSKLRHARFDPSTGNWVCKIETDLQTSTVTANYLVDATGRAAALGKLLGVQREQADQLFSYSIEFKAPAKIQGPSFSRIEATRHGWWYCNQISGTQRIVASLHCDCDTAEALAAGTRGGLLTLLADTKMIADYLGEIGADPAQRVRGAPAGHARNTGPLAPHFLAVGDAGQSFDPLSSQGLWRAMASGVQAGQLLSYALANRTLETDGQAFISRFEQAQAQAWAEYTASYKYFYSAEPRWADQPFWARRSGTVASVTPTLREIS